MSEECRRRAIALLKRNLSPEGILAATPGREARQRGYASIFGRDAAVCAIGMLLSGDGELIRAARTGIETLGRHQAPNGQIPKFVNSREAEPDFWYLGCIDATLWWLIALAFLDAHAAPRGILLRNRARIGRALAWLAAQEHQRFFLLQQNEASDWADIMPRSGFVLYTNALWYYVKRLYRVPGLATTGDSFNTLFHPFGRKLAPYKRARLLNDYSLRTARDRALYLSFVNFSFCGDEGDVFGNVLAALLGAADERGSARIVRGLHAARVGDPYPVRAVVRPIPVNSFLWRGYMSRHRQNFAWQYHNGGIWPMVGGFWTVALAAAGKGAAAAQALAALERCCALENWSFTEWRHGRTLAPNGMPGQSWNAAAWLMAERAVATGVNPFEIARIPAQTRVTVQACYVITVAAPPVFSPAQLACFGGGIYVRRSTLAAALIAAFILVVGVFYVARTVLVGSFVRIETDAGKQNAARLRKALEADLEQLAQSTADYAQWDEIYRFVGTRDPEFIRVNFAKDAIETLHVDLVWIADSAGQSVIGFTPGSKSPGESPLGELTPLPETTVAQLTQLFPHIAASQHLPPLSRLIRINGALLAFGAVRIVRSDLSGPEAGYLLFGRYLNASVMSRLEQISQLPVRMTPADQDGRVAGLPAEVDTWAGAEKPLAATNNWPTLVRLEDPSQIQAYTLLFDERARPLAMLSTASPRDALQVGKQAIMGVIIALTAGFAALIGILLALWTRNRRAIAATEAQRRIDRRRLKHLARHDSLTGLPNRLYLHKRLPAIMDDARRRSTLLAVLRIDIDRFKDVNDSLGHANGDRLLVALAMALKHTVGLDDIVARVSADEFIVVAGALGDVEAIDTLARKIQTAIAVPLDIGGVELRPSASIGIGVFPTDGVTVDELMKNAGAAMAQALERGRAQHQFFTPEMHAHRGERLQLEQALRGAIHSDQLSVEYQPTFDLETERPMSFEALVRWKHPEFGIVPPSRFIPIAEQGVLIHEIGEWVLREVCRQLNEWQRERVPLLPISINVSARQFGSGRFAQAVVRTAREFGVDANLLHFEITERAVMQDTEEHLGTLQSLRRLGSRILIDDFGTGYSSLSYLKHLPIDTLKIDRAFVRDMASDPNDAAIVSAIVGIAMSLGLNLVAEGIETAEQLECLRKLGCHAGQGYYFQPPLPAAECRLLLVKLAGQRRTADTLRLRVLNVFGDRV